MTTHTQPQLCLFIGHYTNDQNEESPLHFTQIMCNIENEGIKARAIDDIKHVLTRNAYRKQKSINTKKPFSALFIVEHDNTTIDHFREIKLHFQKGVHMAIGVNNETMVFHDEHLDTPQSTDRFALHNHMKYIMDITCELVDGTHVYQEVENSYVLILDTNKKQPSYHGIVNETLSILYPHIDPKYV